MKMIEIFVIGLLAGAGLSLKFTGTYFHTKYSPIAVLIPISRNKILHLHHWFLSLIMAIILWSLLNGGVISKENPYVLLAFGFLIANGSQGIFLKNAFRFIDPKF